MSLIGLSFTLEGLVQFKRRVTPGNYFFLKVTQKGGKDTGGKNADAWTAPVFFVKQG